MARHILTILSVLLSPFILPAQTSPFSIHPAEEDAHLLPENVEIRRKLYDWLKAPINEVVSTVPRVHRQMNDGGFVQVRAVETSGAVYQLFLNQRDFTYPVAGRGNVIFKRKKADGSFLQMKIFLGEDSETFLRIFPFQDRTSLDTYLYGKRIIADIALPFSFDQLLTAPLSLVTELTARRIPWEIFKPMAPREEDRAVKRLVDILRQELSRLGDGEDGAIDEWGEYVYIDSLIPQEDDPGLNCSGFAKWAVDGFVIPLTGAPLAIEPLKAKHLSSRGNSLSRRFEDERDPFFGLDWTRNLSVALASLRRGAPVGTEETDVRRAPFFSYVEDVGYPMEELKPLLYLLARSEPGNFYLGSLNRPFGEKPPMRQHIHVALLFPYFDGLGKFHVSVMERGQETSLASLKVRYKADFIHLVRVSTLGNIELP